MSDPQRTYFKAGLWHAEGDNLRARHRSRDEAIARWRGLVEMKAARPAHSRWVTLDDATDRRAREWFNAVAAAWAVDGV